MYFLCGENTRQCHIYIITDSVVLWKIQKFDWLIPDTKWHSCLHNITLCSATRIHSNRVEPEKLLILNQYKRPKGPHIVHLSTMCHLFEESAKADIFVYWSARKTQTWKRMLKCCFLSSFVEFRSAVLEEKSKMSQPIRGQGGHLVFPISPKNTYLVEDIEILLPVKFRWIPLSGFRGEVENVSANQRPGRPSSF